MTPPRLLLALAVALGVASLGRADSIKKTDGQTLSNVDVTDVSSLEVTFRRGGQTTTLPVNEIDMIRFTDDPARLTSARTAIEAGRNEDAVTGLESIDLATIDNALVKQDVQFYTALAKARIALAGADPEAVVEAGRLMAAFVNANPNSYHYLQACELVGDMLVAAEKYEASREYYGRVGKAPWPEYKMRAGVAIGRALSAEGKPAEALEHFETVLGTEATGESAARQRLAATLGKARCLAHAEKSDEAVAMVEPVIDQVDPEDAELSAQTYNALGLAHRKAGRNQDALLAYLHVDVLYFSSAKEHVEALQNLVDLWDAVQQPERADEAANTLQERYGRSPQSN